MVEAQIIPEKRWQFGAHTMWEAAPDVLRLDLVGLVEGDELKSIVETQLSWGKDKSQWFSVVDMSRLGGSTPESRAYMSQRPINPTSMSIAFGANFAIRILVDMLMRARRVLQSAPIDSFLMVATEADAWVEIERRRKRREA